MPLLEHLERNGLIDFRWRDDPEPHVIRVAVTVSGWIANEKAVEVDKSESGGGATNASKRRRKPGPEPIAKSQYVALLSVVESCAGGLSEKKRLAEVCRKLDEQRVEIPLKWKNGDFPDEWRDTSKPPSNCVEALEFGGERPVKKVIHSRIRKAKELRAKK